MSRIGKKPVPVPSGVKVAIDDGEISVEGKLGSLRLRHRPEVSLELSEDGGNVIVGLKGSEREGRAFHGLTRSLINNMVIGVSQGYEKRLEIVGVGYLAAVQGKQLQLRVGYANEVQKEIPDGLEVTCPTQTLIVVKGCDKQVVGQFAAEVRAARKPEPYKGKGVRYAGERVKIKPGKSAN